MSSRCLCLLLSAGLVAGLVTGCSRPPAQTSAPPAGAKPEPIEVRFTYSEKACYLPVVVAVEKGFYEEEGLKVVPKIVTGGIESAEALVSGQADLGAMGDAPTVIAMSKAEDIRLVCTQALGTRMHTIVVRNDTGIQEPRDLEGKRLAVQMGSSTHGGLLRYLDANGVDASKIEFVALSPRDFPEAMVAKQVDAIAGSEPWPGNTLATCKESREFANLENLGSNYPLPIIARGKFLDEHPAVAGAVCRATQKAVDLIKSDAKAAAAVLAARSGVPVERELKAAADYDFLADTPGSVIDSLKLIAGFLKEQGKIQAVPDIDKAIDRSGLRQSEPGPKAHQ